MKHFFTLLAAVVLTASTYAQVGIGTTTPDASSALDITSTTGGLLVPRMTAAQRDAITTPSQGLIIFCTDCASGEGELQIKLTSSWKNTIGGDVNDPLAIGDTHQGGIVFYLDGNGGGLIAAPSDQSSVAWGCDGQTIGGTSSAVGTGAANTTAIVSGCSETFYAAALARAYTGGGYTDWFLPSQDELNLMYENIGQGNVLGLGNVGNFANNYYWSSTELNYTYARRQLFSNGLISPYVKYFAYNVRAVRAF